MPKNKILIVDDEMIGRQLLEAVLLPSGYEIYLAADGFEAIEKAKMHIPDIVLMDVMMPEMDGYETVKQMKTIKELEKIPIIMVTALDDRDSRIKGLEQGAIDYISKPFDRIEILTKIKNRIQEASSESDSDTKSNNGTAYNRELETLIKAINTSYIHNDLLKNNLKNASTGLPDNFEFGYWAHSSLEPKAICIYGPLKPIEDVSFQNSLVNVWISEFTQNNSFEPEKVCSHIYKQMKENEYFNFEKSAWWLHFYVRLNNGSIVCSGFNQPLFISIENNTQKKELEKDNPLTLSPMSQFTVLSNDLTTSIDRDILFEQLNKLYNSPAPDLPFTFNSLIQKTNQNTAYCFSFTFD